MHTVPRLHDTLQPEEYWLELDLTRRLERQFSGSVGIQAHYNGDQPMRLHARDLDISEVRVDGQAVEFDQLGDELTLKHQAEAGDYRLNIDFSGRITDAMHGLYPCYFEVDGQKKELLATQFESHHAREVFPCIDEPAAKAVYNLALKTEPEVTVLGNMPQRSVLPEDGQVITMFEPTPVMSSYLLAFVVGELQKKTAQTKDGTEVNVYATLAQPADSLDFGLDVAVRSIEFFNDYFGVTYPLPKADHVALPDFSSGAMENWGLITYREVCLLADQTTAISSKQYIATVIAHETSHQWFGNLVTMAWWDDLWLNESFATLMEYVCVDHLFPDWQIWMNFATHEVLSALRRDYLPGVQAIRTTVNHPDEISSLFDPSIVYAKGARSLAMCRALVGDEAFRQGLANYFQQHKYQNTVGQDLWQALSAASGRDVAGFMTPWIERSGMPRLHVSRQEGGLRLRQEPFILPAPADPPATVWPILVHTTATGQPTIFDQPDGQLDSDDQPVNLNRGAVSHAVVDYDADLRQQLLAATSAGQLGPVDRLNLLHDTTLLARAGDQTAVDLLDCLQYYRAERAEPVWDIIALAIADLRRLIEGDEPAEAALKQLVADLAAANYQRLGWQARPDDSDSDVKLRATIIGLLAYADDQAVIDHCLEAFEASQRLEDLPAELRAIIFGVVTKHGSTTAIKRLLEVHQQTANSELQNDIVAGLTASRDPQLLADLVGMLKDDAHVRRQDLFRWFAQLIRNRHSRDITWQWMVDNWQWIEDNFAGDKSYDDFARYSAAGLSSQAWLDRYRQFFDAKKSVPALKRAIELGEVDIQVRSDWHGRDQADLIETLTAGR